MKTLLLLFCVLTISKSLYSNYIQQDIPKSSTELYKQLPSNVQFDLDKLPSEEKRRILNELLDDFYWSSPDEKQSYLENLQKPIDEQNPSIQEEVEKQQLHKDHSHNH